MQEFIDKYPETKRGEQVGRQRLQDTIVALLKHISKHVDSQANLPTADKVISYH
jgi:hemerythrin-like domain-containing protein